MKTESKLFTSWNNINNLSFNKKLKQNSTRFLRDIFCSGTAGNCCLIKDKTKKVYFSLWSGGLLAAFLVLWRLVWSWETTLNHFVSSAPKSLYYGKELQSYKVFEGFQLKYVPIFKPSTVLVMKQVMCCYTIGSTTQVNDNLQTLQYALILLHQVFVLWSCEIKSESFMNSLQDTTKALSTFCMFIVSFSNRGNKRFCEAGMLLSIPFGYSDHCYAMRSQKPPTALWFIINMDSRV